MANNSINTDVLAVGFRPPTVRRSFLPYTAQSAGIPVSVVHTDDHPGADFKHIVRGVVRRGLQPVPSKASISLRVGQDVPEWFKAQGPGYQTRINTVLRALPDASI